MNDTRVEQDARITELGAAALARAIAAGELTAKEAVDAYVSRAEAVNPAINAIVVPLFEQAREEARRADGVPASARGPLHGVPVTVKECFDVKGTPTTVGVVARSGHRADRDAPLVARLREAGAIVLGKTNVSQLLMFVETDNPVYGTTRHPRSPLRSSGGSSGGEGAIVAARGSALGLGTDIGGSVRVPAHCCGVHSIKPTPGRLRVDGTVPILPSRLTDAIPDSGGLLARSVGDLRLALRILSPVEEAPAARGLRIGFYVDDGYFTASAAIRRAVTEAASQLVEAGYRVQPFVPPDVQEAMALFYGIFGADRGATWRTLLDGGPVDPRIADLVSLTGMPNALRPVVGAVMNVAGQPRLARALRTVCRPDDAHLVALTVRLARYRERFAEAMRTAGVDVLLCPPCGVPAFLHGTTKDLGPASVNYTSLFNVLAYPAGVVTTSTVRAGETNGRPRTREKMAEAARRIDEGSEDLPVGVQVASLPGRDGDVLAVMEALDR